MCVCGGGCFHDSCGQALSYVGNHSFWDSRSAATISCLEVNTPHVSPPPFWLFHSFHPFFYEFPKPWRGSYRFPLHDWAFSNHLFSVLWLVLSFCSQGWPLQKEASLVKVDSSSDTWCKQLLRRRCGRTSCLFHRTLAVASSPGAMSSPAMGFGLGLQDQKNNFCGKDEQDLVHAHRELWSAGRDTAPRRVLRGCGLLLNQSDLHSFWVVALRAYCWGCFILVHPPFKTSSF